MKCAIISLLFVGLLMGAVAGQDSTTTPTTTTTTGLSCLPNGSLCFTSADCCNRKCRSKLLLYLISHSDYGSLFYNNSSAT